MASSPVFVSGRVPELLVYGKTPRKWQRLFMPVFQAMLAGDLDEILLTRKGEMGEFILKRITHGRDGGDRCP